MRQVPTIGEAVKVTKEEKRAAAWQLARSLLILAIPVVVVILLIAQSDSSRGPIGLVTLAFVVGGAYWVIRLAVRHGTRDVRR